MKTSTFILSFLGFCVFYIGNADWIDELYEKLVEDYLLYDYEEVAPFISSVRAGAEEFDQLMEELAKSKRKWYQSSFLISFVIVFVTFSVLMYHVVVFSKKRGIIKASHKFLSQFYPPQNYAKPNKEEIQNLVMEFLENKFKHIGGSKFGDDIPVKLLWKGGTLVESSIHCNIRDDSTDSRILHMQKHLLQSKLLVKCPDLGSGDEKLPVSPTSSEECTALKIAEIRQLLESEPEMIKTVLDKETSIEEINESVEGEEDKSSLCLNNIPFPKNSSKTTRKIQEAKKIANLNDISESVQLEDEEGTSFEELKESVQALNTTNSTQVEDDDVESPAVQDSDGESDVKLMNRIRLLETRLRLEELKNKNWINRMSRAEGILQQLNKQVERGIDSVSKGVNSSLLSGRANRGSSSSGNSNGDSEDYEYREQLGFVPSSEEKYTIHTRQSISTVFLESSTSVHVAE